MDWDELGGSLARAMAKWSLIYQQVWNRTWRAGQWRSDEQLVAEAYTACCRLDVWNYQRRSGEAWVWPDKGTVPCSWTQSV